MNLVDDRILEVLSVEGPHTPLRLTDDTRVLFSRQTVQMRLLKLYEAGFVDKDEIGRGVYSITEQGEQYLAGEFDARDLPEPDTE